MSKKFYVTWCIIYLVIMFILIVGFGKIKSWMDFFSGFVMGFVIYSLMIIYRDRNKSKRNLK